jgi:hypothetical protein
VATDEVAADTTDTTTPTETPVDGEAGGGVTP